MERHIIGEQIKKMRGRYRMSQVALADKLDVSKQSVSNWERGIKMPRMDMMQRIADVFDIDITELTSDTTKSKTEKANSIPYGATDSLSENRPTIHGIINVCLNLTPSRILNVYDSALRELHDQNNKNGN